MTKKEYLIKVFSALEVSWEPAKGLRILLENQDIDQDLLDTLVNEVKSAVNDSSDDLQKEKLQKTLNYLEVLKKAEEDSRALDQKDILELENIIQWL